MKTEAVPQKGSRKGGRGTATVGWGGRKSRRNEMFWDPYEKEHRGLILAGVGKTGNLITDSKLAGKFSMRDDTSTEISGKDLTSNHALEA